MNYIFKNIFKIVLILFLICLTKTNAGNKEKKVRPNIIWIVSEDNTTLLGCYGDKVARTPVLDKLASEGILFENAFCNSPVCAPSRSTIITGMYANSLGTQNMRSMFSIPSNIKFFTQYLRDAGYYCSNNPKEDYNTVKPDGAWDESSKKATYENRKEGQPFFSVFNFEISHESKLHISDSVTITNPNDVRIPRYQPDTKEMRHDWAQYYDRISTMDFQIGELIKKLEKQGLLEETIIFYYGDNGGVLPRSKRFLYEEGTHIPLIIRVPKKYQSQLNVNSDTNVKELVSLVDLAPTVLELAGIEIPKNMQGHSLFGKQFAKQREYVFMFRNRMDERIDFVRAVRDMRFRYIRNFMPTLQNGQHIDYLWMMPAMKSWAKLFEENKLNDVQSAFFLPRPDEELYDISNDPYQINNLANNPKYKNDINRLRTALEDWMIRINDTGFIPEVDLKLKIGKDSPYEYLRSSNEYNVKELLNINKPNINLSSLGIKKYLQSSNSVVRYWGLYNTLKKKVFPRELKNDIENLVNDKFPSISILASEILVSVFDNKTGLETLKGFLNSEDEMVRTFAINGLDRLGNKALEILPVIKEKMNDPNNYVQRIVKHILSKTVNKI